MPQERSGKKPDSPRPSGISGPSERSSEPPPSLTGELDALLQRRAALRAELSGVEMAIRGTWKDLAEIDLPSLTRRETEVLDLVRMRLTNKEIGAKLFISERTVKFHVSTLLKKIGVDSRMALL